METAIKSKSRPIRVLLVDDHPVVLQGLKFLLEQEQMSIRAVANSLETLAAVEADRPDLALVDLSLGEEDGTAFVAKLCNLALPSIAYSIHEDQRHVKNALAAGALGYVTKREVHRVLVQAIFEVANGGRFNSPKAAKALAEQDSAESD